MLTAETKQKVKEHAQAMLELLGLRQGHLEVHVHKGDVKEVTTVDKSLKFEKQTGAHE
jgi:hypothetical protein